jgi:hypothetical protein
VRAGFGKLGFKEPEAGFRGGGVRSAIMKTPLAAVERIVLDTMESEDFGASKLIYWDILKRNERIPHKT